MYLQRLVLTNFKNYDRQSLELSPGLNCFTGLNGMGKTNLLDAIYFLCIGKSRSALTDAQLCRHGADFFRLEGWFKTNDKLVQIVAKVQQGKRKVLENNGLQYANLSEHVGLFPVVFIGPDDTQMLTEGSEERRKFIDNTLSQTDPMYLRCLMTYQKVLLQRNTALKQFAERGAFDAGLIQAFDAQLVPAGQYIYQKRKAFAAELEVLVRLIYRHLANSEEEDVQSRYCSHLADATFEDLLAQNLNKDRLLQRTTAGVHRDDLELSIRSLPVKRFASQGQLKSMLLALKLAQYRYLENQKGVQPVLLLDDLFDKLDAHRVAHLFQYLQSGSFGQVCITDTDAARVEKIVQNLAVPICRYQVENGSAQLQNSVE